VKICHVRWEENSREISLVRELSSSSDGKRALSEAAIICRLWGGRSLTVLHVLLNGEPGTLVIDVNKEDGVFIPRLRISEDIHEGRLVSREYEALL